MLANAIVIMLLMFSMAHAEEPILSSVTPTFYFNQNLSDPLITITSDGQIEIKGKPIERMSDPEIRAAMREIVDVMKQNSRADYYDRQTGYLLQELEKCNTKLDLLKRN